MHSQTETKKNTETLDQLVLHVELELKTFQQSLIIDMHIKMVHRSKLTNQSQYARYAGCSLCSPTKYAHINIYSYMQSHLESYSLVVSHLIAWIIKFQGGTITTRVCVAHGVFTVRLHLSKFYFTFAL